MIKKEAQATVKWNKKARNYLEVLGILDRKTGTVKKSVNFNMNNFINECIIFLLERDMLPLQKRLGEIASFKQLKKAMIKFENGKRQDEIKKIAEEITKLAEESERLE